MAKLCSASMPQSFLHPRCRTMSKTIVGFTSRGALHQEISCSAGSLIPATVSHGIPSTSMILQATRCGAVGMGTKTVTKRRIMSLVVESPSSYCQYGDVTAAETREDLGSTTGSAGFVGRGADDIEWREEVDEESVVGSANFAGNQWRHELDSLFHGHVGRFAFLAILAMGVGVACLTNAGDAEAVTGSHISSFSDRGLDVDMRALAFGPEGPLVEEFWDNMRRYGLYFLTVVSGGIFQLVKPAIDALKNPVTAVLIIVIVTGSIYLVGLTVSAMLGINEFAYDYAS